MKRHLKIWGLFVLFICGGASLQAVPCDKDRCVAGHIGLGGAYYGFGGEDIKSYGGYLSLESRYIYLQRAQIVLGGLIGGGSTLASNAPFGITDSNTLLFYSFYAKLGLNIASKATPLFLNLFIDQNKHNGQISYNKGLYREISTLGAELSGFVPLSQLGYLDYGLGLGWAGVGKYEFPQLSSSLSIQDYSYRLHAHIGISRHITANTLYYVRLIGQYYDLKATDTNPQALSYPASRDFVAMIEIGIKGFDK